MTALIANFKCVAIIDIFVLRETIPCHTQ